MSIRDFRSKVNVNRLKVGDYIEIKISGVTDIIEVVRETSTRFVLKNKLYISKKSGRITEAGQTKLLKKHKNIFTIKYRIVTKEQFIEKQQNIEKKKMIKKIKPHLKHLSYDDILEIYSKIIDKVGVI